VARHPELLALDPVPMGTNPYLQGNYAPVAAELDVAVPLEVDGAIPPMLEGLLLRNGPNPAVVSDPHRYHWFSGDGMVHAIELRGGQAIRYQNRWVRTRRLAHEIGTVPPRGPKEPINGPANTHVVSHAGKILALVETGFPHRLSSDLDTLGVEDFDATLTSPMTAHPKVDPGSGALVGFGYDIFGPPYLRYFEIDAAGAMAHQTEIALAHPAMIHDFALGANLVAFMDLPVVFDPDLAAAGHLIPFGWRPEEGARVGLLPRGAHGQAITWFDLDPCYVFHVMNAFDDGVSMVLDVCRYESALDTDQGDLLTSGLPHLERWHLEKDRPRVQRVIVDDTPVEFPRVDDLLVGRAYRYGYGVVIDRNDGVDHYSALIRYDRSRDESLRHVFGPGQEPGEPIFVRAPDGNSDDEGWVLCVVFDAARGASDLVILDASRFTAGPEAVIHLPARVPHGFHGSWVPLADYR
jgi:carotenoid cleavage dioxygenase-like enzyme